MSDDAFDGVGKCREARADGDVPDVKGPFHGSTHALDDLWVRRGLGRQLHLARLALGVTRHTEHELGDVGLVYEGRGLRSVAHELHDVSRLGLGSYEEADPVAHVAP